ncbi:hypothetical protein DDE82_001536 [Stemphylium lycopersici]|nr:hypothetical protein DDE82_001536 [Stemphylium lycopersici]
MDPLSLTLPTQARGRRRSSSRQAGDYEEAASKPKKVNSEIRKQQNRIASRNYREKRRRKLQYLQQLVKDDEEDREVTEDSPERQGVGARSLSTDQDVDFAGSSPSPYHVSPNDFGSTSSRTEAAPQPVPTTSTASFSSHHAVVSQAYAAYPQNWIAPVYSPPPPAPPNGGWNIPPAWISGFEHSANFPPHHSIYQQTSKAPVLVGYNQTQTHLPQSHAYDTHSNAEIYGYGSSYASQQYDGHNLNGSGYTVKLRPRIQGQKKNSIREDGSKQAKEEQILRACRHPRTESGSAAPFSRLRRPLRSQHEDDDNVPHIPQPSHGHAPVPEKASAQRLRQDHVTFESFTIYRTTHGLEAKGKRTKSEAEATSSVPAVPSDQRTEKGQADNESRGEDQNS